MKLSVYIDDGRVFEYECGDSSKVREHSSAIISTGYRHCEEGGLFEHYPPHRILKVKATGVDTMYPDKVRGT